jgi:hypothetical protein
MTMSCSRTSAQGSAPDECGPPKGRHDLRRPALHSMFVCPLATLDLLREQPRCLLPLLLAAAYAAAVNHFAITHVGLDRVVAAVARANASVDPRVLMQHALSYESRILAIHAISTFAGSVLTAVFAALFLWLSVLVMGGETPFRKVLAVVSYAGFLITIVKYSMVALTVSFSADLNTFDLKNLLATNAAFFIQPKARAVFRLLSSLDIISLAHLTLLAAGVKRVSQGVSSLGAFVIVVVPWGIYVAAAILMPWLP